MEVFHMCLLLGFQGKYMMEGSEKLNYLTSRLGDEITHLKGKRAAFAPHWSAPDRIAHQLRHEVPLWVLGSVFGLLALTAFIGLRWQLGMHTRQALAPYENVVQLAPQTASITITLP
jgi:type VI secretion system protein ImpK